MTESVGRRAGRVTGSVAWLGVLYCGLLYLAVGALGVSQIVGHYGDRAAYVFQVVAVLDELRQQQKAEVDGDEAKLIALKGRLQAATDDLLSFGVAAGLSSDKVQSIIDHPDQVPLLAALLGKPADATAEQDWAGRAARVVALDIERNALEQQIKANLAELRRDWASQIGAGGDGKDGALTPAEIDGAAATAATLQRLGFGTLFSLPREILTLTLALVMGALGSTLQITKTLVEGEGGREISYYLMRPFQGMVTALVVHVVLKAGQLTISAGGNDGLNTFFVAFVGIVSGLMSQEAYRMIQKAGAAVIQAERSEARWAFKLAAALKEEGQDTDAMAAGIGASSADVQSWLAEKQPVPVLQQRLISAWLRRPARELFTSEPPTPAVAEEVPAPGAQTAGAASGAVA